ncbi:MULTISPECIES: hypothetical protein [Sutcliffiella]|uniref:Uncharacterized protein n=1 Tax=Sutcliffiella cohnii TaxID=33932 RepID=A0A223KVT4_9BACI|nr:MULTISPECIES: hypothetical protein [Sutcliffiella]AST93566.1 hypothetical protein BC6307_20995 [Sutcliffiella cohnii]WBL14754.1 hypothetical protein O1A01_23240 [Sutcliffiella sp. NC1]
MKKLTFLLSISFMFLCVIVGGNSVGAQELTKKEVDGSSLVNDEIQIDKNLSLEEIFDNYELEVLDESEFAELSSEVGVLNFESKEDFHKFLIEAESQPAEIHGDIFLDAKYQLLKNNDQIGIAAGSNMTRTHSYSSSTWMGATLTLTGTYNIYSYNSFRSITEGSASTRFSGFTVGLSWTETNKGVNIASNGQSAYTWAEGTVGYVIFIEGIGTVYERPTDIYFTYHI